MKIFLPKIFSLAAIVIMMATSTQAEAKWTVGVTGGYTYNTLSTSSGYNYDRNFKGGSGFSIAAVGGYQFNEWLGLNAEIGYIEKSYKTFRTLAIVKNNNATVNNGYVQLPIYASFSFGGKRLRGFTNVGAFVNYWVSSHTKGTVDAVLTSNPSGSYDFDTKVPFDSRRDNRVECGLMAGLGLQFAASELITVYAEGRYYYSLTDMQKMYQENQIAKYNNTIGVQVGVKFKIPQL